MATFKIRTLAYGKELERVYLEDGETSVTVPDGVTKLGIFAFKGLTTLKEVILPDSVEECTTNFYDCPALKHIRFSENMPGIGSTCFLRCTGLEEIRLPPNIREIGNEAFKECTSLREVVLGEHTDHLWFRVFQGCTALQRVPPKPGSMLYLQLTHIFETDPKLARRMLQAGNLTGTLEAIAVETTRHCDSETCETYSQ